MDITGGDRSTTPPTTTTATQQQGVGGGIGTGQQQGVGGGVGAGQQPQENPPQEFIFKELENENFVKIIYLMISLSQNCNTVI